MTDRWRYGILTTAAVLALVLVVADFILSEFNRSAQIEINERQQFINQGIELSRVNQTLVRAIAIAAVKDNDSRLKDVLAEQGITVSATPTAPAASSPTGYGPANNAPAHKGNP